MEIAPATVDDADAVTDLWVALADEQTEYGSHVLAERNRAVVHDEVTRQAVTDRLLVARGAPDSRDRSGDDSNDESAADARDDPVVRSDGPAVVGFAMFAIDKGSYEKTVTQGVVQNLYVAPAYRNEGIGGRLLEAAERRLEDLGAETVVLETMAENLAARRFYRRHGYDQHRVRLEKPVDGESGS